MLSLELLFKLKMVLLSKNPEWIWSKATECCKVSEVDCSMYEQANVDNDDEDEETDEG